ncbi:MAG: ABC transporter permease, partial [Acidobacteriaceae bacterium]|nr:ABC transporter permease [Acidobacteriaceae bacterium]
MPLTVSSLAQDFRYGVRQLRLSPGFTLVAVLSLSLGIGANTAIFQLIDAVRLRTLPVRDPGELGFIDFAKGSMRSGNFSTRSARLTWAQFDEIRREQQAFSDTFAWSAARFNLATGGESRFAEGLYVTGSFFRTLGVSTVLGRTLEPPDDTATCANPGAVLSYAFWQREYGADRGVLGRNITLDGHALPIVGVTAPAFNGVEVGNQYDLAIPLCADPLFADNHQGRAVGRYNYWLSMMGRLKPGWTLQRADAQLRGASPAIMQATVPEVYKAGQIKNYLANKLEVTEGGTGISGLRRQYEQPLWLLMAITGLVLLIACANLANLLLARASIREREIAVRLAVGASRTRLIRQLLVESLILAMAGTVVGALLAQAVSRALIAFISTQSEPLFVGLGMDWTVLGFSAALAVVTCLVFGLMPALRATQLAPVSAMRASGRGTTAGRERFSLRRGLVVTQVALSVVLLVGALLFVRSLSNLMTTDAGFKPEGVLSVSVDFGLANFSNERRALVFRQLHDHLAAVPGVSSVARTLFTPISNSGWDEEVGPDGAVAAGSGRQAFFNRVSPGYFKTMGTRFIAGRDFDERDTLQSPKVAIVNEKFAEKYFGGANPVGHSFHLEADAGKPEPLFQIVGLVGNAKYYQLKEDFRPTAVFPALQDDQSRNGGIFVARVSGSPTGLMNGIKAAVAEVSPSIGIEFRSFSKQIEDSLLRERLMATLSGAFGLLAAL